MEESGERDQLGRFVPGHPGRRQSPGRPKGLRDRAQAATHDGADIVRFMLDVLHGRQEGKTADRIEAAKWLADRGWGKAEQTVNQNQTGEQVIRIVRDDGHSKS